MGAITLYNNLTGAAATTTEFAFPSFPSLFFSLIIKSAVLQRAQYEHPHTNPYRETWKIIDLPY